MTATVPTVVHHLRPDELGTLTAGVSPPCLSLYLPTHRITTEAAQDRTRLRTLVAKARSELEEVGLRGAELDGMLRPATELLDDPLFWQRQEDGLALLLSVDRSHLFQLPYPVPELAIVGERFHLHPLVELLQDHRALLITLSQQLVRLFEVSRWSIREVEIPGVPEGIADTLRERDRQTPLQVRHATAGSTDASFFHGHGGAKDTAEDRRRRYLLEVDRVLQPILKRREDPVVLAGVRELAAEFRALSTCRSVVGEVPGNPDSAHPDRLRDAAWEVVAPWFARQPREALERFEHLTGTRRAETDPEALADAAMEGRIDVLFVRSALEMRDEDPTTLSLIDDAVVHTLRHGGAVYVLTEEERTSHPDGGAILRY
jgi:hypothetical protein